MSFGSRLVPTTFALAILLGCRGGPREIEVSSDAFFPPPPDLPRVQFVRSFNGSADFQESRAFLDYLAGEVAPEEYELKKPFSVATWKGRIYVTDSFGLQGLNVFDLEARRFYVLGKAAGPGELKKPIHVFVDGEGFKYISDVQKRQVLVYGPDDSYVRSYGDGRSFLPVACVRIGAELFVLDVEKDRVKSPAGNVLSSGRAPAADEETWDEVRRDQILVFSRESGEPLRRIGGHGSGEQGFSFASFLATDAMGALYVSDFLNHRVVKLDREGNVLSAFGEAGTWAGQFSKLKGIAVDRRGLVYAVDAAFQAVQVLDNSGKPLFAFGGPRAPKGPMDLPAGIWIDTVNVEYFRDLYAPDFEPEYLILVANQLSRRHSISIYAYGKRRGIEYPSEEEIVTLAEETEPLWRFPVLPADAPMPP